LVGDGVVLVPGMEQFDLIQGPVVSNFIDIDNDTTIVGYIKPFYFVRTMDAVCSVCFVVIVVGTGIVVNSSGSISRIIRIVVVDGYWLPCCCCCCCNVIIIIIIIAIAIGIDGVVVGYIKPFYFVRTMDAVGSVCLFVVVMGTCIVVDGCLDNVIIIIIIIIIIVIISYFDVVVVVVEFGGFDEKDIERRVWRF
jgi:hypothetical protein